MALEYLIIRDFLEAYYTAYHYFFELRLESRYYVCLLLYARLVKLCTGIQYIDIDIKTGSVV